jgi:NADH-quinone oxidoreductase subunit A
MVPAVFAQSQAGLQLGYGPIAVLIVFVMIVGTAIILITQLMPKLKRQGARKDAAYESGMEPIGDARRRFNVRFYLVAMLFLLFDVELIFMYPWAMAFTNAKATGAPAAQTAFLFWEMALFFVILLVGYIYAWGKGVFRYD